jgi:hypothetical protein
VRGGSERCETLSGRRRSHLIGPSLFFRGHGIGLVAAAAASRVAVAASRDPDGKPARSGCEPSARPASSGARTKNKGLEPTDRFPPPARCRRHSPPRYVASMPIDRSIRRSWISAVASAIAVVPVMAVAVPPAVRLVPVLGRGLCHVRVPVLPGAGRTACLSRGSYHCQQARDSNCRNCEIAEHCSLPTPSRSKDQRGV